jgi:hypothetical protein
MVGGQVMKRVEAPSGIVEVGDVGTWVHLLMRVIESARQASYKGKTPQK